MTTQRIRSFHVDAILRCCLGRTKIEKNCNSIADLYGAIITPLFYKGKNKNKNKNKTLAYKLQLFPDFFFLRTVAPATESICSFLLQMFAVIVINSQNIMTKLINQKHYG